METILERFYMKIDADYEVYFDGVKKMTSSEFISNLKEIAAMQEIYETLKTNTPLNTDHLQYLLRFKNPLYVIHGCWMSEKQDISEALNHTLWNIWDKRDAEQDYPLEENIDELGMQRGVEMC
ncbi:MAG: DUF3848 domain-containing protein [Clostridiales bacterium]|nr:DUF3848 domain-containing protein [Eubacteriales bacterium]MDH7567348.1 DUF3848 domain-containing protein [Clostridiales bacterium]